MATETEKKAKVKKPTALKRDLQNERNRLRNKSFRSRVSTAIRDFVGSDKSQAQEKLSLVYSLVDKGLKKGIFKQNKADRIKSRMTKRLTAKG
ncbi:MAG: 30S ribosomal protein S20 [Chlamydiae bacterium]|nr:30S ribosomal protein S20 [Chlamydiota bacterium]